MTYNYLCDGVFDSGDGVFDLASTGMHIHTVFCTKTKASDTDVQLGQSVEYLPVVLGFQVPICFALGNVSKPRGSI